MVWNQYHSILNTTVTSFDVEDRFSIYYFLLSVFIWLGILGKPGGCLFRPSTTNCSCVRFLFCFVFNYVWILSHRIFNLTEWTSPPLSPFSKSSVWFFFVYFVFFYKKITSYVNVCCRVRRLKVCVFDRVCFSVIFAYADQVRLLGEVSMREIFGFWVWKWVCITEFFKEQFFDQPLFLTRPLFTDFKFYTFPITILNNQMMKKTGNWQGIGSEWVVQLWF